MKILEISGLSAENSRVHFVVPENIDRFPNHFSLAQVLLYSPRVMNTTKSMIKGKQAYMVPGVVSSDDIKLSIAFNIPLMAGEPQK
jgi:IQ domain-containing protein H